MTGRRTLFLVCVLAPAASFLGGCPGSLADPARFAITTADPDGGTGALADGGSSPTADSAMPSTSSCNIDVVSTVLENEDTCASSICHDSDDPAAGLDLLSAGQAGRMVGVVSASDDCAGEVLIDPDDPANSLLLRKLEGTAGCGESMPYLLDPLPDDQLACMRAWVEQVAASGGSGGGAGGAADAGADTDAGVGQ